MVVLAVPAATVQQGHAAPAARVAPSHSETTNPVVFFRTVSNEAFRPLRRVMRVDPVTGRRLPSVTPPADFRNFVDATQAGDTSFVVWTSTRGELWLGAAGRTGRIARRWRVGRAGGFEVRPAPANPTEQAGVGLVRVSADRRTALLVNGRGRRIGRYVDLRSGLVRERPLPAGVRRDVASAAVVGKRFVLIGFTGALVTVDARGDVVARGQVQLPPRSPDRIGFVNLIGLPGDRAVMSFITGWRYQAGTRRLIARYDARTGAVKVARSYADFDGYEFAATPTRFVVFGDDHWTAGRIDGGPLQQVKDPGPGSRPPAAAKIEPDEMGGPYVSGSTTTGNGKAVVLRVVAYANSADANEYSAYEALDVDIAQARVLRRVRYADDVGGASPLPYAFDIRIS